MLALAIQQIPNIPCCMYRLRFSMQIDERLSRSVQNHDLLRLKQSIDGGTECNERSELQQSTGHMRHRASRGGAEQTSEDLWLHLEPPSKRTYRIEIENFLQNYHLLH